ncbi:hypothetical protein V8E51_002941 [Hyaloscypha variabilis]
MTSLSSTCATHGSLPRTPTHESLSSKAESSQSNQSPSPNFSISEQRNLSASRIIDYLKKSTTSHVELQHVSFQESTRIQAEKKSFIKGIDDILVCYKK